MSLGQLGVCPDCGTELTRTRGRRSGKSFLWCWKCERAMRPSERRKAMAGNVWRRCIHCNGSDGNCEECAGTGVVPVIEANSP